MRELRYGLSEVSELFDTTIITGTIVEIFPDENEADVHTEEYELQRMPFFYHCEFDSDEIDSGYMAFEVDDEVTVIVKDPEAFSPEFNIVGFADSSIRYCSGEVVLVRWEGIAFLWNPVQNVFVMEIGTLTAVMEVIDADYEVAAPNSLYTGDRTTGSLLKNNTLYTVDRKIIIDNHTSATWVEGYITYTHDEDSWRRGYKLSPLIGGTEDFGCYFNRDRVVDRESNVPPIPADYVSDMIIDDVWSSSWLCPLGELQVSGAYGFHEVSQNIKVYPEYWGQTTKDTTRILPKYWWHDGGQASPPPFDDWDALSYSLSDVPGRVYSEEIMVQVFYHQQADSTYTRHYDENPTPNIDERTESHGLRTDIVLASCSKYPFDIGGADSSDPLLQPRNSLFEAACKDLFAQAMTADGVGADEIIYTESWDGYANLYEGYRNAGQSDNSVYANQPMFQVEIYKRKISPPPA